MIRFGKQGNSTLIGKNFESKHKFEDLFKKEGYKIEKIDDKLFSIKDKDKEIGYVCRQGGIYRYLRKINPKFNLEKIVSKKLFPDTAFINLKNKTLYIIEMKEQNRFGSVDEKLQTCDFKKQQWEKIVRDFNLKVEYYYLLNSWFKNSQYQDTLKYIKSKKCKYFFNKIELKDLGINKEKIR